MTVPAHQQRETIHLICSYPEHETREHDPYYHLFNQARKRMKEMGLLKCVVCGKEDHIELHHSRIEFSLQAGVDLQKFNEYYGLHLHNEDEFRQYIEGPGNLEALCQDCHRGPSGIHVLPQPFWEAKRVWRADLQPPAQRE